MEEGQCWRCAQPAKRTLQVSKKLPDGSDEESWWAVVSKSKKFKVKGKDKQTIALSPADVE